MSPVTCAAPSSDTAVPSGNQGGEFREDATRGARIPRRRARPGMHPAREPATPGEQPAPQHLQGAQRAGLDHRDGQQRQRRRVPQRRVQRLHPGLAQEGLALRRGAGGPAGIGGLAMPVARPLASTEITVIA